ncbi:MAG: AAA family ATPase [Candidatus Dadabacteria bacterium]|nr:MAG: AAA family ATPase [Candidatus Dadabacteria bacterium]
MPLIMSNLLVRNLNKMLHCLSHIHSLLQDFQCILITGCAGTGKSTMLTALKEFLERQYSLNCVALAPTGVAALNIQGETIHSFFRFPPEPINEDKIYYLRKPELINSLDILLIDEISMVRADLLDGINMSLKKNRSFNKKLPYGGVKIIFFGDLLQLPPVTATPEEEEYFSTRYETPYFFSSDVFNTTGFAALELETIYRQKDPYFISLLSRIRSATHTADDLDAINQRVTEPSCEEGDRPIISLTATKALAEAINREHMRRLKGKPVKYTATIEGTFNKNTFPAPYELSLKPQAQVMFLRNDLTDKNWVNGTIGRVSRCTPNKIFVEVPKDDGTSIECEVAPEIWENLKYTFDKKTNKISTEVIGKFKQFPLMPAWAVTIHKSQGKTFEKVIIDLGRGAFAPGQLYVALSRCTSLNGIHLCRPITEEDIIVDKKVINFIREAEKRAILP